MITFVYLCSLCDEKYKSEFAFINFYYLNRYHMKKKFLLLLLLFSSVQIFANVTLPKIFGDNMVLQRNRPIPIWGWADANEKINVQFNHQTKSAVADKNGY